MAGCGTSPEVVFVSGDPASGDLAPAEPAYGALIEAVGPEVEVVAKDLEVYAASKP
jgi:hypothetical protein